MEKLTDNDDGKITSGTHMSYWTASETPFAHNITLSENIQTDVVIVGGGISGLSVAYCLALKGKKVVVVEDGLIGSGETGRTTAHLATALDDRYYELERIHGEEGAKLAYESHASAINFIEETIVKENINCEFERLDGYLFLNPTDKDCSIEKEWRACIKAGMKIELVGGIPGMKREIGFGIKFPHQAQFHIMKYLKGLCKAIENHNGLIFTQTHAKHIDHEGITTEAGFTIKAEHIVVATNTPVNNLFALHTKQSPHRTYVIAAKIKKGLLPKALWWDTGDFDKSSSSHPYHYVRLQNYDALHQLLLCGGEDHITGKSEENDGSEHERYNALESWAREYFPIGEVVHRWSGQVMETMDGLAYIGRNARDKDNVYVVTGDSGNGMTHGTIAGILISDMILGHKNEWEKLYNPSRFRFLASGQTFIKDNLSVLEEYFSDYPGNTEVKHLSEIKRGEGKIIELNGEKFGAYCDENNYCHVVSAVCTHLQCIVKWNNDELSWDCPCHGSRFTIEGKLLNGPANEDLPHYKKEMEWNESPLESKK